LIIMHKDYSPLDIALREFEAAEANLAKLERLWGQIESWIPDRVVFGSDPDYDDLCRLFAEILEHLPAIDGWLPENRPMDLNEIAQSRLDAWDIGEIEVQASLEEHISAPGRDLREYRFRLNRARRKLIQEALLEQIDQVDTVLKELSLLRQGDPKLLDKVSGGQWEFLKCRIAEIDTLLGGSVKRPERWNDLRRHLVFGLFRDLHDIISFDWPKVKSGLSKSIYGENDPLPVTVKDLGELVASRPRGPVTTKLKWEALSPEDFERLIFTLISGQDGYENPEWLMRTNAPDRGRDLSVMRVTADPLSGVMRDRVIIQCKHWLERSVSSSDVVYLKEQLTLWEPPRVDVCIIATSGRFSSDAVALIERHNQSDRAMRIEMWPESHLERLLAARPHLIGEFRLR
jgi:hypothetical protein